MYDLDEMFPVHQRMSDVKYQPSMNKSFKDAEEFFGRTVEEYREWLISNTREQLDFVIMDLIRLSQKSLNDKPYQAIKESGYFWLKRDINRSVEETIELVAKHFGME